MKKYWMLGMLILMMNSGYGQDIVYGNYSGAFSHRASTPNGYIDLGPRDANWAHIFTDRPKFLFNQPVYSSLGVFSSLGNNNLQLQTDGSTKLTILKSNGYVGLGTATPSQRLEVRGHALISNNLLIQGTDLKLGLSNARGAGEKPNQRALVHNTSDRLFINYDGDFEGGIVVQGPKTIIDGKVGVGTSSPQGKMEIRGTTTLGQKYRPDHAHLKISSGSIGLLIDSNEIYGNDALLMGSSYTKDIVFRNVDANGFEDLVWIKPSGNVGIGTNSPKSMLNVSSGVTGDAVLTLEADTDNNNEGDNARIEMLQDGGALGAFIGFDREWGGSSNEPDNLFRIGTRRQSVNNFNRLVIDTNTGNVGVGTDNPTQKLSVNGTIRSKEIICEAAPWPDYVFEDGYDLQPLSEVKTYIEEEGHLPGIPSAAEVEANGVTLAKMNALLLEKIEELTLHVIRLEERLEEQNNQ